MKYVTVNQLHHRENHKTLKSAINELQNTLGIDSPFSIIGVLVKDTCVINPELAKGFSLAENIRAAKRNIKALKQSGKL